MSEVFNLELLRAVSAWQQGGDFKQNKKRGEDLKKVCERLPEKYKVCSLCCFRQVALPKGSVCDIIAKRVLTEKISSWTYDIGFAKQFKGGIPPKDQGYQGMVICVSPEPREVVVNLWRLYQDSDFREAMTQHKSTIPGYYQGAGRYGAEQSEVVLEMPHVERKDILHLGGHSSSFDELLDRQAVEIYGRSVTKKEKKFLNDKVQSAKVMTGPRWLDLEATERVINRMDFHIKDILNYTR